MRGMLSYESDLVTGRRNEINTEDDDTSAFMYVLTSIYMYLFIVVLAIVMAINAMADNWEKILWVRLRFRLFLLKMKTSI